MNAIRQQQFTQNTTPNLMNFWGAFSYAYPWAVKDGTGSGVVNNEQSFKGENALKVTNTSTTNPIEIYSGETQDIINLTSGSYFLSFAVFNPNAQNITGRIRIYDALTLIETIDFDMGDIQNQWVCFSQLFTLSSSSQIQLGYEIDAISTSASVYFDGVKIGKNNQGNEFADKYSIPQSMFVVKAVSSGLLNFTSVGSNDFEELNLDCVGAVLGDVVVLGTPVPPNHCIYDAYVSATDVVTIRCTNVGGGAVNPDAGTFKVFVLK
jgi:hypothetical protein